jgi:hypothetical protein
MANNLYPKWKEALLQGSANSALTGTVKFMIIDAADYTYSAAHDFLDDVPAAARVATSAAVSSKTYTDGVFDCADVTFSGVSGDQAEALIGFIDTGTESTSRLVCYLDTAASGLPVTPNGGNITVTWDSGANKIFAL